MGLQGEVILSAEHLRWPGGKLDLSSPPPPTTCHHFVTSTYSFLSSRPFTGMYK